MDSMHDKGRTFPDAKILNFPERTMSERKNVYRISNKDLENTNNDYILSFQIRNNESIVWKKQQIRKMKDEFYGFYRKIVIFANRIHLF